MHMQVEEAQAARLSLTSMSRGSGTVLRSTLQLACPSPRCTPTSSCCGLKRRARMSSDDEQEYAGYGEREQELRSGTSQGGNTAPFQQFSNLTAQGASRFHAGNSYVQLQNNYYTPTSDASTSYAATPHVPTLELVGVIDALVKALEFPEMNLRLSNIKKEHPKTCTWFEGTEEFERWRNPSYRSVHRGMLFINGVPGSGKSTIMRYAYNKDRVLHKPIAFFFNARGRGLEKSTEGMFRSLLCQLLDEPSDYLAMPNVVKRTEMKHYKEHGWPLEVLKELFLKVAQHNTSHSPASPLVCYIDALDECAEDQVRELLEYFEDLSEDPTLYGTLLFCFSNRPYPNITISHCETIVLAKCPGHTDDIRKYALSRLHPRHLGIWRPETEQSGPHVDLVSEIISRSSGVFLWVVLVTAQLKKSADHGVHPLLLRKEILKIPPALNDLFDTMVDEDGRSDYLLPLVQWVLFAQGPLRAIDLYSAINVDSDCAPEEMMLVWKDSNENWLHNFILTGSKGFMRMTDTQSASHIPCEFIHDSVREYFLNGGLQKLDSSLGSDVVGASHARLAKSCQQYLQMGKDYLPTPDVLSQQSTGDDFDVLDPAPLFAYIRDKAPLFHAEIAERSGISQADFCGIFNFTAWLALDLQYPRSTPEDRISSQTERATKMRYRATTLHVFVDNQMENLIQRELQIHATDDERTLEPYINAQCGGLGTALHLAVERNNTSIIRALVTSGAHIDFRCQNLGTPLDYAILLKQTASIEVLLQLGATTTSGFSRHQRRKILV